MQDHQHTIDEVFTLQEHLDSKAATNHKHAEYAEVNHKHSEYANADHSHGNYAAATHKHSEYAPTDHTHDDLQAAIEAVSKKIGCSCALVLREGASIQIDGFHEGKPQQIICTNTDKVVHIKDYFVSSLPKRFNCQNIIIAPGKTFAARVLRTATVNYILFDGILNEL